MRERRGQSRDEREKACARYRGHAHDERADKTRAKGRGMYVMTPDREEDVTFKINGHVREREFTREREWWCAR